MYGRGAGTSRSSLFAFNRLDLQNLVNLTNLLVQTGLIVLLFLLFGPSLTMVGAAYLMGAMFSSIVSIAFARRVCPELRVALDLFDRYRLRDLGGMSWWVIINQVGSLLFLQIDLIVVNLIFGPLPAGEYAVALQWATLLRSIAGVLSGVLTPMVLTYYARERMDALITISRSAVKVLGLAMALPVGLVCGLSSHILTIWVGEGLAHMAPLMVLLTVHLTVNLAVTPLFSINVAFNKVRIPGVVTVIMGIGNFLLAVALSLFTDLGYYGVAIAGAIVLTSKNALFTPWYATKVLGIGANAFMKAMLPGIAATVLIATAAATLGLIIPHGSLPFLILVGGLLFTVYSVLAWHFGLSDNERTIFGSFIPANARRSVR